MVVARNLIPARWIDITRWIIRPCLVWVSLPDFAASQPNHNQRAKLEMILLPKFHQSAVEKYTYERTKEQTFEQFVKICCGKSKSACDMLPIFHNIISAAYLK